MTYSLKEIRPNIFLADFNNEYDLAMTFCRYQEFYESDSNKFRNKSFLMFDFMEWYAKKHNNVFSYTADWSGFNLPIDIIDKVNAIGIKDRNKYDAIMSKIVAKIKQRPAYLIGTCGVEALAHEIAHGLFYTNKAYKKDMTALVENLKPEVYKVVMNYLMALGYGKNVHIDECQAYLATGIQLPNKENMLSRARKPFIEVFNKYANEGT